MLGQFFYFISYPVFYGTIVLSIVWVLFFSRRKIFNFSLLFLSVFSSWVLSSALKFIFQISRPYEVLNVVPYVYEGGFSFPSSHAAMFGALTYCVFYLNKKAGYIFLVLTLVIGISRIVLGVHYPSDILAGFALGAFIGWFYVKVFNKL